MTSTSVLCTPGVHERSAWTAEWTELVTTRTLDPLLEHIVRRQNAMDHVLSELVYDEDLPSRGHRAERVEVACVAAIPARGSGKMGGRGGSDCQLNSSGTSPHAGCGRSVRCLRSCNKLMGTVLGGSEAGTGGRCGRVLRSPAPLTLPNLGFQLSLAPLVRLLGCAWFAIALSCYVFASVPEPAPSSALCPHRSGACLLQPIRSGTSRNDAVSTLRLERSVWIFRAT